MTGQLKTSFRYFPCNKAMEHWGINILSCGYGNIPAGQQYPPPLHPEDHQFSWDRGRILNSYCFLYIAGGKGVYESFTTDSAKLQAGTVLLLRPGLWHRYKPDTETGWDEYWLEFSGEVARRLINNGPLHDAPEVIKARNIAGLTDIFIEAVHIAENQPQGFEYLLARQAISVITTLISSLAGAGDIDSEKVEALRTAREILVSNPSGSIDLPELAMEVGMSYSLFRKTFKRVTGLTPYQYRLEFLMRLSERLLVSSDMKITDIAEKTGFGSLYYFSKTFKKKTGMCPSEYRRTSRQTESSNVGFARKF
jgi:AraC-like DNA-binding protein